MSHIYVSVVIASSDVFTDFSIIFWAESISSICLFIIEDLYSIWLISSFNALSWLCHIQGKQSVHFIIRKFIKLLKCTYRIVIKVKVNTLRAWWCGCKTANCLFSFSLFSLKLLSVSSNFFCKLTFCWKIVFCWFLNLSN